MDSLSSEIRENTCTPLSVRFESLLKSKNFQFTDADGDSWNLVDKAAIITGVAICLILSLVESIAGYFLAFTGFLAHKCTGFNFFHKTSVIAGNYATESAKLFVGGLKDVFGWEAPARWFHGEDYEGSGYRSD